MTIRPLVLALFFALTAPQAGGAAEPASGEAPSTQASAGALAIMKAPPLRVSHWSGAYGTAERQTIFKSFTNRTGIDIVETPYDGGIDALTASDGSPASFDVVDFAGEDAAAACAAGLLTEIDPAEFLPGSDQTPAAKDFVTRLPCAVPSTLTGEVLIYDASVSSARTPQRVTDIFDLARYPGKRGLKRDATGNLELALLADGVAAKDVYTMLATQNGITRAFAKLDTIKSAVVWWEKGGLPATLVGHGDVVMSTAYNTRAFEAVVSGVQIAAVWNQAPIYVNGWGVLKSARDQRAALEFVKFATDSARLSQIGEAMPYGPARRSALASMSPEMRAFSPTAPEHLEKAFVVDADFWQKNGLGLRNRFELWLTDDTKPGRQASLAATEAGKNDSTAASPEASVDAPQNIIP